MTTEEQEQSDGPGSQEGSEVEAQSTESSSAPPRKGSSRAKAKQRTQASAASKTEADDSKPRRRSSSQDTAQPKAEAPAATKPKSSGSQPARRRRSAEAAADQPPERPKLVSPRRLPRMLEKLRTEVGPAMMQEFGYTSPMQIPRLTKVVLNIGLGEALLNAKAMENATGDLSLISGQKPVTTRAKKSIAGFKIRQGMPIGVMVTLRGRQMHEFMDRLISSTLPRIRDFQGVPRESFDGRGNYSLGIREQVIFPEIDYNSIDRIRGLQIVIGTTARTDREGLRMLELLGMPFAKSGAVERVA